MTDRRTIDDLALRSTVYRHLADTGTAPSVQELCPPGRSETDTRQALRRLHDRHMLVLDERDEIAMALPFSARPTLHRVIGADCTWWANCAWDALAVVAALDVDARIESVWLDDHQPIEMQVVDRHLDAPDGSVHFAIPARRWWDDIVET